MRQLGTVARINDLLRRAGRSERLVRGRGYYYLTGGDAARLRSSSIYAYRLDPEDFELARGEVNAMLDELGAPVI